MRKLLFVALVAIACVASAATTGKKYSSADKAVDAFITAIRKNDVKSLVAIFGADSQRFFNTGDAVADKNLRSAFLTAYDEKHELSAKDDGSVLLVGNNSWPFPIPLVKAGTQWRFDTAAGLEEILNRRIGRNELDA